MTQEKYWLITIADLPFNSESRANKVIKGSLIEYALRRKVTITFALPISKADYDSWNKHQGQ